jgi:sulfur transfer complex TusBCD TusB component (DsrH family)
MLEEGKKVLVWGDAVMAATSDPYLAYFLQAIEAAGQVYVSEAL